MKKIKNAFITGGLGFIGSNIVRRLLDEGYNVKIYDNYSSGNVTKLTRLGIAKNNRNLSIVRGDILDKNLLTRHMKGADIVFHKAAQLEITKAVTDPYYDLSSNTIGTLNILNAMLENNITRLINASSACIYGQKEAKSLPTPESDSTDPNWAYGVSKLAAEKYCSIYAELYGFNIISTRYAIVYGQNEWYGRVMPIYIKRAMEGKALLLFDDGSQTRDFIHVDDVVTFNIASLEFLNSRKNTNRHEAFNVSTSVETTIKKLAMSVVKEFEKQGEKAEIEYDTVKEGQKSKRMDRIRLPSELKNMVLDNTKAKKMLGWIPEVGLEDGLHRQIQWAKEFANKAWSIMSY